MAEIFGAVSSGAGLLSLAFQLVDSAKRLKGFYERARDAPGLLLDLSHELETISLLLQHLERHRQEDKHDTLLLERCISRCREKTAQIESLIESLERKIRKFPGFGKAYFSFKDEDIRNLLQDLERAKSSIMAAFQAYSWACQSAHNIEQARALNTLKNTLVSQNRQLQDIRATGELQLSISRQTQPPLPYDYPVEAQEDSTTIQPPSSSRESPELALLGPRAERQTVMCPNRRRISPRNPCERSKSHRKRISFASWLTGRIWELAVNHAEGSWTVSLKTYNLISGQSPIFALCMQGDLEGIQNLFARGEASIMDCDVYRKTPFIYAAQFGHIKICRFLLSHYGSSTSSDAKRALNAFAATRYGNQGEPEQMYKLFLTEFDLDFEIEDEPVYFIYDGTNHFWMHFCPNQACVDIILRGQTLPYLSLPLEERFQRAILHAKLQTDSGPACMLTWAGLKVLDSEFATFRDWDGSTPLHVAAEILGRRVGAYYSYERDAICKEWAKFSRDLLLVGSGPSAIAGPMKRTPLTLLLNSPISGFDNHYWKNTYCLVQSLKLWKDILLQAGINLTNYALQESHVWDQIRFEDGTEDRDGDGIEFRHVFGYGSSDISVEVVWKRTLRLYELKTPPGAWPSSCLSTSIILWEPTDSERDEGPWTLKSSRIVESSPVDMCVHTHEWDQFNYSVLVDSFQDDSGIIARRAFRRKPISSRRSRSQPPALARRELAHIRACRSRWHPWLSLFHLCPYDMTLRFDCVSSDYLNYVAPVRDCVHGVSISPNGIREDIANSLLNTPA